MTTLEPSNYGSQDDGANRPDQTETAPLIQCNACGAEARDRDRFCRRCGANLTAGPRRSTLPYVTSPLTQTAINHRVSGTLLASVSNGVSANLAAYPISHLARRVMAALISIPIWMIIILLSPLDAYFTAQAIARQS
jgi:hypothetical protein